MIQIRFRLWFLCLAVLVAAVLVKLTLMMDSPGAILMIWVPFIFLGPRSGVAIDRYRGGTGQSGGLVAGLLTGITLGTMTNVSLMRARDSFDLAEFLFTTTFLALFLGSLGWFWGWSSNARRHAKSTALPPDDLSEMLG